MNLADKALWFIESHYGSDIRLDDIAASAGVSRFHLARAFEAAMGCSLMRYVRRRRLTEAARALSNGAADILAVALEAGYGSHEAFTRAFRDQFGHTPEQVRADGHVHNLKLMEAMTMDTTLLDTLEAPRFVTSPAIMLAGLVERFDCASSARIPALWQRFQPFLGTVSAQVGKTAYGVCYNQEESGDFDYMCGVEVNDLSALPNEWSHLRIPGQRYAVFVHHDHIATIRRTWNTIWNSWLPTSGHQAADAPRFELYSERFNPQTGLGGVEIWVPLL